MEFTVTKTNHDNAVFYGIDCKFENKTYSFIELTTDKTAIDNLRLNLENGKVSEITLYDIIDDFINT